MQKVFIYLVIALSSLESMSQNSEEEITWFSHGSTSSNNSYQVFKNSISSVVTDGENIYISGLATDGSLRIDGETFDPDTFDGEAFDDRKYAFVAKYNSSGSIDWLKKLPNMKKHDLALSKNKELYVVATEWGDYIHKYNESGELIWDKEILVNATTVETYGVTLDENESVLITGAYSYQGNQFSVEDTIVNTDGKGGFILKYDRDEQFQRFFTTLGGIWCDFKSIETDSKENILLVGDYVTDVVTERTSIITLGEDTLHATTFHDDVEFNQDIVIAKLDSKFKVHWVRTINGEGRDFANGVAVNLDGDAYLVGTIGGSVNFGDSQISGYGDYDIFLAKINSNGEPQWINKAGSDVEPQNSKIEAGRSVFVNTDGDVLISGSCFGGSIFGKDSNSSIIDNVSEYYQTGFLAKYASSGELLDLVNIKSNFSTIWDVYVHESKTLIAGNYFKSGEIFNYEMPNVFLDDENYPLNFFVASIEYSVLGFEKNKAHITYPNPFNDEIFITKSSEIYDIALYDVFGGRIFFKPKVRGEIRIDMTSYTDQLYFLHLISTSETLVQKIIRRQ